MAYKVVYNNQEYTQLLMHICEDLKTKYNNKPTHNLGYHEPGNVWTWDCWNLPKSIIWGWNESIPVGKYQPYNPETGLGDWGGAKIMSCCREKSTEFSKITPGEFMMTPGNDHAGTYVGDFTWQGKEYNVVECTTAFGGGVVPSYVSSTGGRYSFKGGHKNGSWARHGKLPWIDYSAKPADVRLDVDGWFGVDTATASGELFGIEGHDLIQNQALKNIRYLPRCSWTAWQFKYKIGGDEVIRKMQALFGLSGKDIDGQMGPISINAMEHFLADLGYYEGKLDDKTMGPKLVKAWQRYLNDQLKNA